MIYGGVVTRSRNGNKAHVERKVGDCWQWQATAQCSKGNSCGFNHVLSASGNGVSKPVFSKENKKEPVTIFNSHVARGTA